MAPCEWGTKITYGSVANFPVPYPHRYWRVPKRYYATMSQFSSISHTAVIWVSLCIPSLTKGPFRHPGTSPGKGFRINFESILWREKGRGLQSKFGCLADPKKGTDIHSNEFDDLGMGQPTVREVYLNKSFFNGCTSLSLLWIFLYCKHQYVQKSWAIKKGVIDYIST